MRPHHVLGLQHHILLHGWPKEETQALTHLNPQALNGTNNLQLGVLSNAQHGQALLFAIFDNLGKGASGAAVQNLDLMLRN